MGNALQKKVNAIRSKRLTDPPYILTSLVCPICAKPFDRNASYYLVPLACYIYKVNLHLDVCSGNFHPKTSHKARTLRAAQNLREQFDKVRISWTAGCDEIMIDREQLLDNSLLQIKLVDLHKV